MVTPLSRYLTDEDLGDILTGCTTGRYEAWMPHPVHRAYLVSSFGRVWSDKTGKILKACPTQTGYSVVGLNGKNRKVHQLVLETFISPRPYGMHGCHWDSDKLNNRLMNLRWDTPKANQEDRRRLTYQRKRTQVDERNRQRRERLARVLGAACGCQPLTAIQSFVPALLETFEESTT